MAESIDRSLADLAPALEAILAPKIRSILKTGRPAIVSGVPFPPASGRFSRIAIFKVRSGFGLLISDTTEACLKENELEDSLARIKELAQHDLTLREDERRRTARNIHDEMAPLLTTLKIDLYWILKRLKAEGISLPQVESKVAEITDLVDNSIVTVRKICSELRPALLEDLGLQAAMEWQVQEFRKTSPIQYRTNIHGNGAPISPDLAICLFRIFQEGFANILRHSEATQAAVSLLYIRSRKSLELRIRDNGKGIRPEDVSNPKSFGLIGMRERLSPYNGRLTVSGIPGKGTTLTATVPVPRSTS